MKSRISIRILTILTLLVMFTTVATAAEEEAFTGGYLKVHVTAEAKNGTSVDMEDATVYLYVGDEVRTTAITDEDGIARLSLGNVRVSELSEVSVCAAADVSHGMARKGTDRDVLYQYYPKYEADGEIYRYRMELRSEWIDSEGNWRRMEVTPKAVQDNVDIVFVVDSTKSMSAEITRVKDSLEAFSAELMSKGLDVRFALIEYGDISYGEATKIHTYEGSCWFTDVTAIQEEIDTIVLRDGGDDDETLPDALGYVCDATTMKWRSDAHRIAFVVTDTGYKNDNTFGYENMAQIVASLKEQNINTSVITTNYFSEYYRELYEETNGAFANIYAEDIEEELTVLAEELVGWLAGEVELKLSEPRMYVNMSVGYLSDSEQTETAEYKAAIKNVMNEYTLRIAEATDGHVQIEHIIIVPTDEVLDFYTVTELAAMTDIHIESSAYSSTRIHSNAHAGAFYIGTKYGMLYEEEWRTSFLRIQMSGTEGAGWNYSLVTAPEMYSTTLAHESGHYLLGLYDEYLAADGEYWGTRPTYNNAIVQFGLMDNNHYDIELSNAAVDYAYITDTMAISDAEENLHTKHSWHFKESCEDSLVDLMLTDNNFKNIPNMNSLYTNTSVDFYNTGDYKATYTKVTTEPRTATYAFANRSEDDFIVVDLRSNTTTSQTESVIYEQDDSSTTSSSNDAKLSTERLAEVSFADDGEQIRMTLAQKSGCVYRVNVRVAGGQREEVSGTDGVYLLPIAPTELAEVRIVVEQNGTAQYNSYYVDRSPMTDKGYYYTSVGSSVELTAHTDQESCYTMIADNHAYTYGDYFSVNQATVLLTDGADISSGEVFSVANANAALDYASLSWFVLREGVWTKLDTTLSDEESLTIGARAALNGDGIYVLMAKKPSQEGSKPAEDLTYEASTTRSGEVVISFTDPNENSKYYRLYYSTERFDKKSDAECRTYEAKRGTQISYNLGEEDAVAYVAVEIILNDGTASELGTILEVHSNEIDSDGDGIPDWYCTKYLLWGDGVTPKDIANSDDDGDGLTNLEEYLGGSDPINPNDPVSTVKIPVEGITATETLIWLGPNESATYTVTIEPVSAYNTELEWIIEGAAESIGIVTKEEKPWIYTCTVTAKATGEAKICAVTMDGGFSAAVNVNVLDGYRITFLAFGKEIVVVTDGEGRIDELPALNLPENAESGCWETMDGRVVTEDTVFTKSEVVVAKWIEPSQNTSEQGEEDPKVLPYVILGCAVFGAAAIAVAVTYKRKQNKQKR